MSTLCPEQKLALVLGGALAVGSALGSQLVILALFSLGMVWYQTGGIPGAIAMLEYVNRQPLSPPTVGEQVVSILLGGGKQQMKVI